MGLFSTKSQTASTTTTEVRNVGASEGSIVASEGSTVNVLDAGAIDRAFDFSEASANAALESAFKFASESLGLVKNTVTAQQRSSDTTLSAALASKDEAQSGGAQRLLVFGGLALAGIIFLAYLGRG